jgi:hypothetical protein
MHEWGVRVADSASLMQRLRSALVDLGKEVAVIRPTEPVVVQSARPVIVHPNQVTTIAPAKAERIAPIPRQVWDEKNWSRKVTGKEIVYLGTYHVVVHQTGQVRTFDGRIVVQGTRITTYIHDPPAEIGAHPKKPCFAYDDNNWFRLNWYHAAQSVGSAILYMERILDEALNHTRVNP